MAFDFPIIIKRPGMREPKKSPVYYIIAANGLFLHKKLSWVEATIPVKRISVLEEQEMRATVLLPPLPRVILAKTVAFFRKVYAEHKSEAIVLLHYNKDTSLWDMSVPRQQVSSAAISDYDKRQRIVEYACMGTIHSHASMSAFHSGTDRHDEAECADGIHITIGNMNEKESFSIDTEVAVNGHRFPLPPTWCDGVSAHVCKKYAFCHSTFFKTKLFDVQCEEIKDWEVPDEWMREVLYSTPWVVKNTRYGDTAYDQKRASAEEEKQESEYPLRTRRHTRAPRIIPMHEASSDEEEPPSVFTKIKEILDYITQEPYERKLHSAYCTCRDCKKYLDIQKESANANFSTTRDGIRVMLDAQKEIPRICPERMEKRNAEGNETLPEGTRREGKKTQKLSWFSQMVILTSQKENEIQGKEKETAKKGIVSE